MGVPTANLPTGGELFHSRREWIAAEGMEIALEGLRRTLIIWGENL
jgi:di/tripeptidase